MIKRLQEMPELVLTTTIGLMIFVLAIVSPVTYASSDPFFSLVLSQAVLEERSLSLESFVPEGQDLFEQLDYQITEIDGKPYYNYPLGTSLFSLPIVWLARIFDRSMLVEAENHLIQNIMSAILTALIFILAYYISRAYLPRAISLTIALIFLLGTSLISTLGTALWNLNFSIVFMMLALYLVVNFDTGRSSQVHPFILGIILFCAFFSRPSSAFFILVILIYLLIRDRKSFFRTTLTAFILLLVFVIFSKITYGSFLPSYYQPSSWYNQGNFISALYGLLFSPSRGLFIFSPFLLLVLVIGLSSLQVWRNSLLFCLCLFWVAFQTIAVAFTNQWWGGFSYGPRLLADTLPAYFLMTVILWWGFRDQEVQHRQNLLTIGLISLGLWAVYIHTIQGMFNVKTPLWNASPNVDEYPEYISKWNYPQFLVTRRNFHERLSNHYRFSYSNANSAIENYMFGELLVPDDHAKNAFYVGWWFAGLEENWTEIEDPKILFVPSDVDPEATYQIELQAQSSGKQTVKIILNEHSLGTVTFPGPSTTYVLEFTGSVLKSNKLNEITLLIPDASTPGIGIFRTYGLRYLPHRLGLLNATIRIITSKI